MINDIRSGWGAQNFWGWFAREADGYRNAIEALTRGEADATSELDRLDRRVKRIHGGMRVAVSRAADGGCQLTFSGREDTLTHVLKAARNLPGWQIGYDQVEAAPVRRAARRKTAIRKAVLRRGLARATAG